MTCTSRLLLILFVGVAVCAARADEKIELMGPPPPERLPMILPAVPPADLPPLEPKTTKDEAANKDSVPVVVTPVTPLASVASNGGIEELFGRFLPRIGYSYDAFDTVGRDGGLSAFQLFLPFWQDRDSTRLLFSDSRLLLFDARGTVGANLGLGGRLFSETLGCTLGGYLYWDYSDTGRASFNQVSGGIETLGDRVDARANFYVPIGRDRKQVDQFFTANTEPYFQNNLLYVGGGQGVKFFEQALYGFDTEAGLKLLAIEGLELRAFAGMYHYQGEAAQQAWGPRGRLEARVRDSVAVGLSIQNDRLFGTTVNCNCLISYGRLSGRSYNDGPSAPLMASDRLGDPVVRMQHVAVDRQQQNYVVAGTPVVDPRTNQPYLFLHVAPGGNSDGSFENPYQSLAQAFADPRFAQGNVVVYDRSGGVYQGNVKFAEGTQLLSSSALQVLRTTDGSIIVPHSGTGGPLPRIQGTVFLASHSTISGFDLVGVGRGAVLGGERQPIRDVALLNNQFSGQGASVWLPSVAGLVHLENNRFVAPEVAGIMLGTRGLDTATIQTRNNQINHVGGDAISVVATDLSQIQTTISHNKIDEARGNGILVMTGPTAQAKIDAKIEQNEIRNSALQGSGGVTVLTTGSGESKITASVKNNQLLNNEGPGFTARVFGPNTLALDLFTNKSLSNRSMFGYLLQQQNIGEFQLVDPSTLGSRNVGSVMTTGTINEIPALPN